MRDSLKKSIDDSIVRGFERYPSGSIVICNACAAPIFKIEGGIALGDKAGRMAERFKPLTLADLNDLAAREDIDVGLMVTLRSWDLDKRKAHIACLREVKTGEPMVCPVCAGCFVQVLSIEKTEALDRSFTLELVTIPPKGSKVPKIRGRQIGANKQWIH